MMNLTERQEQWRKELHAKFPFSCRTEFQSRSSWPHLRNVEKIIEPANYDRLVIVQEKTTFWFFSTEEDLKKFEQLTKEDKPNV